MNTLFIPRINITLIKHVVNFFDRHNCGVKWEIYWIFGEIWLIYSPDSFLIFSLLL